MWHYVLLVACAIPCYGVWTYISSHPNTHHIAPITMYGLSYLGHMVSVAQPTALSYRSSTLYGAAEQAVGGAATIASLSIASIISPQVRHTPRSLLCLSPLANPALGLSEQRRAVLPQRLHSYLCLAGDLHHQLHESSVLVAR